MLETKNANTLLESESFTDEDFAALLDSYSVKRVSRGDFLEGSVIEVANDQIIVDLGLKQDAFVPRQDIERLGEDFLENLKAGDEVTVYVTRPNDSNGNLIVSLSRALQRGDWNLVKDWMDENEIINATVINQNSGGVLVQVESLRGFVPDSHLVAVSRTAPAEERADIKKNLVGKKLSLKIIDIDPQRNRLVLSERAAQQIKNLERIKELEVGSVHNGTVISLKKFGAFVDIGGLNGLVHISELDWQYLNNPGQVLSVGDEIDVKIIDIDAENGRIALSRKALIDNPWDKLAKTHKTGDLLVGKVANTTDYGIFVEVFEGLVGLIHTSQMQTFGSTHPANLVNKDDFILVHINEIDTDQQRVELSLDRIPEPVQLSWIEIQSNIAEMEDPTTDSLTTLINDAVAA